jgi:ABC-2 type transport system ATP-binding protein
VWRSGVLKIDSLSHVYENGLRALDSVSLELQPGMFGLLGPNGAGKSTLMRCLATLQVPTSGKIQFGEIDVLKSPEKLREKLGYLPQNFGFYPRMNALEMLNHLAILKGVTDAVERKVSVEHLLNEVNLWKFRKEPLTTFSGGMKQRFGIAQALLGKPSLIIVDEPTAGLDPSERRRFLNLLAGISGDIIVILSTHIVEDVAALCPKITVLANGQIKLLGSPEELVTSLHNRVWQKRINAADLDAYKFQYDILTHRLVAGEIIIHVLSDSDPENGFKPHNGTLEDVYFLSVGTAGLHK